MQIFLAYIRIFVYLLSRKHSKNSTKMLNKIVTTCNVILGNDSVFHINISGKQMMRKI